jgi:hypothetical protein
MLGVPKMDQRTSNMRERGVIVQISTVTWTLGTSTNYATTTFGLPLIEHHGEKNTVYLSLRLLMRRKEWRASPEHPFLLNSISPPG